MIIFFGTRNIEVDEGVLEDSFECRRCGEYPLQVFSQRLWFTLFLVPCIPLGKITYEVSCLSCKKRYRPQEGTALYSFLYDE